MNRLKPQAYYHVAWILATAVLGGLCPQKRMLQISGRPQRIATGLTKCSARSMFAYETVPLTYRKAYPGGIS